MRIRIDRLKQYFSDRDWAEGMKYERSGRVLSQTVNQVDGRVELLSQVQGTEEYTTRVNFYEDGSVRGMCECMGFARYFICKHLAASIIHYGAEQQSQTDFRAREMLQGYLQRSMPAEMPSAPVRLVPVLSPAAPFVLDGYPALSFRVGYDKLYAVKTISSFLNAFTGRDTVRYGKNLTLVHDLNYFDPRSRRLIALLSDQMPEHRTLEQRYGYYPFESRGISGSTLALTGSAFDRFFDLYRDFEPGAIESVITKFAETDPEAELIVHKKGKGIQVTLKTQEPYIFFGNRENLYAQSSTSILRCSAEFRKNIYPLFALRRENIYFDEADVPTFCTCVLPEIQDSVPVEDPENLLEQFLPNECTPCFYFDMEEDCLQLQVKYRYGEKEIASSVPASRTPGIRRNAKTENMAMLLAERFFEGEEAMYLADPARDPYDFLTEELQLFRNAGEVYLSERLQRRKLTTANTAAVGVSLSDGILTLELDTGEFPREELESLYQSLLRRKKYHRLADGRYMTLDGSGYEKMAEMAHMLQLSAKDLAKGSVTVPAFRALYLDSMLSGSDGITVQRDRQFRQMIREFKAIEDSDYAIPETLENTLRPYQKTGYQWLKTLESVHFGGILADEMGLGKTLQVITYLKSLDRQALGMPSLIVCPASLILNWDEEFRKFVPSLRAVPVLGSAAQRRALLASAEEADVLVTSYELLRQDIKQYADVRFYCCVLDEAQHIKNQSTQISKAVKQLNCIQRFILTGTPIENRLSELWNLFDFLMPGYLYAHNTFVEKLEKPIIKSGNREASAQLQKLVQPFLLRRLKKDVLKELPPKLEYVRPIPLSEEERKVYQASVNAAVSTLGDGENKLKILAALTQLRQICCAPGLCFENYAGEQSKLEACLELCTGMVENGHQILLFSQFTSMLDILRKELDRLGISSYTLQGSTTKEKRAQLVKQFNAGGASVFLISLKAGGTGLNLTAADIVIHYDPWWNIAAQNQATDRAHRIGQQSCVQVYKLIAKGTIEEKILELQEKKASLMELISQDTENGILNLSADDLLALMTLS